MRTSTIIILLGLVVAASAKTYFLEKFTDGDAWEKRWTHSDWKKSDGQAGTLKLSAGEFYGDAEADKGIQTSQDARFYAYTAKFDEVFDNKDKDFVFQFQVRHPQKIDCGGGYFKLLAPGFDAKKFNGDSEYNIMFGPDVCGTSTRKTHVIFRHAQKDNANLLVKKDIKCETDQLSHVYTLIVHPDDTYEVRLDGEKKEGGKLPEDWDFSPPKKIKDPNAKKPADWVDNAKMDDPTDVKPADYDSVPKEIPDPESKKPEDWDDEEDGKWEPATIPNPEWKGEWKPRQIDNPAYKGPWIHPEIDNPDYKEYKDLHAYKFGGIALDVWQVKSGTIFDNIIVTDNVSDAEALMASTFTANKAAEKQMYDDIENKKREKEEAERKKVEEERKKQEEKKEEDDDDEDDDEDEAPKKKSKSTHEDL